MHHSLFSAAVIGGIFVTLTQAQVPVGYTGTPYHDSAQAVPGVLRPERYDKGAKNIAWYDSDTGVTGGYKVRAADGDVDLDPVKTTDPNVPTNIKNAVPGDPYWGWLVNNEFLKFTVDVKQAGVYYISAMVGVQGDNVSFQVDAFQGTDSVSSGALIMPYPKPCPPPECYHYWDYVQNAGQITLKAGMAVIKWKIVKSGYNINYVELQPATGVGINQGLKGQSMPSSTTKMFDASGRIIPSVISNKMHLSKSVYLKK